MRRHIGALGHKTQVTQITLIDHGPVGLLFDAMHFSVLGGINQVEQSRETLAQAHAAAATMADVEHPPHFLEAAVLVVENRVLPIQCVPGGGFEIAFAHAHDRAPSIVKK